MTSKERATFLIGRYGDKSLEIINEIIESNENDTNATKYWLEVKKICKETIKKSYDSSKLSFK